MTFLQQAPMARRPRLWQARLERVAPWFLKPNSSAGLLPRPGCARQRAGGRSTGLPQARGITFVGKADRIDRLHDGRIAIYDYKSGKPPTEKEERSFAKQLWLEAAMAADGAFGEDGPLETARVAYIGLGATPRSRA
jgi:ATP-dependent helicase/nuclease subunit B